MRYLNCDEIKYLQVDHNSTCNLRCPQCARTHEGQTHPDLPQVELQVDTYKKLSDWYAQAGRLPRREGNIDTFKIKLIGDE